MVFVIPNLRGMMKNRFDVKRSRTTSATNPHCKGFVTPYECHILNLESDVPKWEEFSNYDEFVHNFRLAEVGDYLYGIAGNGVLATSIFEYTKSTDRWLFKNNVPQAIEGHCSVVYNDEIWFMGGKTNTLPWPKDTTVYNPTTDVFRVPGTTGHLNIARLNPACGVVKDPNTNNDWILVIGGKDETSNSPLSSIEYFDIQEDLEWKILTTHVPSFETNVTLPLGGSSSGGFIKFGPSRFMLISGSTTDAGISPSNLAIWNRDVGQFHPITSTRMSVGRDLSAVVQIPLHTRWTCLPMGNDWVKMVEQNTDHFFQPLQLTGYANTEDTIISNLDTFELYKSCNDFYHLRLVWPELGYFNEWRQKSNFINPGPVLDYQAIAVRYPNFFGGLIHVNDNAKPDGHPDDTYFKGDTRTFAQYAVGRYSNGPDNRMPGPVGNEGTGDIPISVDKLILYVKKDC
ncbi:uncharacterized protein LOC131886740 [Tigriopus californicus]|nr:uncharacterized protein LOC131886740 [Tigriopus californicus]